MMGWIFIAGPGFDGPHWETGAKNKVGVGVGLGGGGSCYRRFWPWLTLQLAESNSFWEEAQVPLLLLPAQVYDNPNKLWCAAQTLKTLIGTKSNRLCLSGQRELEEWVPYHHLLPVLKSCRSTSSFLSLLSTFVFPCLLAQLVIFHFLPSVPFSPPNLPVLLPW